MTTSVQIRTSGQVRKDFLDFFESKQHTIVPSSSLMPDSPNLLFTNAGMNQFVPIFLGQTKCPYKPGRAADTQKCIRAGGKHNDLEDVGIDTYHHTFFEMLGNWSFGDYFKKESLEWGWELLTKVWKFPVKRLYATVYKPGKGEPSEFDQETYDIWVEIFKREGLDPKTHIVFGNKKDSFWMMGDTGPCGPCSEIHMDLTPAGDTDGKLVNKNDARCIEIWNHVFIQFNANPDGTFSPLPAKHVDTGMGFERVASIIQGTKGFKDFSHAKISNYETDIFHPIFNALEKLSGKKYTSTLPVEHTRPRVLPAAPSRSVHEASGVAEVEYSRRNLPHFERPWAKYMVTFSTRERRQLKPSERDIVLKSVLYAHKHRQYELYAACVMPDHVHLLFEPQIKEQDKEGKPVFRSLGEILQGIKSASAHDINKASGKKEHVWEKESMDRIIRGQSDMEEKFHYVCRNPWDAGVVQRVENYRWLWPSEENMRSEDAVGGAPTAAREGACAPPETAAPLPQSEQEKIDVAFRVIADHIRTLSFAIADGVQPSNEGRGYVLRRILRRAVRYGRTLGFHEPFFYKLVNVLADTMGDAFPEIRAKKKHVQDVIRTEEEAFNKTLDNGIELFDKLVYAHETYKKAAKGIEPHLLNFENALQLARRGGNFEDGLRHISQKEINTIAHAALPVSRLKFEGLPPEFVELRTAPSNIEDALTSLTSERIESIEQRNELLEMAESGIAGLIVAVDYFRHLGNKFSGDSAFALYDTYGFPLDLTELMARERGLTVDVAGFNKLMKEQRTRARAAQKKTVISLSQIKTTTPTKFVGYDHLVVEAKVLEVVLLKDKTAVILDTSVCYAEAGGQVGDAGKLKYGSQLWRVTNTQKSGNTWLHLIEDESVAQASGLCAQNTDQRSVPLVPGINVTLSVDVNRRNAIQRHHTVTHLLHLALHEVVSKEASQKGSYVGPDKLTFDFNSQPLTPQQVADVEKLVNERILENAPVSWVEVPYADVKSRKDVRQFFGEKYGDKVRVLQVGGTPGALNGYSMELCGGTHVRATGEIGLFRIVGESAIAAGVRRIEAIAGLEAYRKAADEFTLIKSLSGKVNSPVGELEKKIESLLEQQKVMEKQLKSAQLREASNAASRLLEEIKTINGVPAIIHNLGVVDGDFLQAVADSLKSRFKGVIVLGGGPHRGNVAIVAAVTPDYVAKVQAGKIVQQIAPIVGGKGGGKPDNARGGGRDASKLDEALAKVKSLLGV